MNEYDICGWVFIVIYKFELNVNDGDIIWIVDYINNHYDRWNR